MSKRNVYGNFERLGNKTTAKRSQITPEERLATAIIIQAYKDYNGALTPTPPTIKYKRVRADKRRVRRDCENFFASDWYKNLTTLDPQIMIKRAMVLKRKKCVKRFAALVLRSRKPDRSAELEDWQKREIKRKRKRRHV